MQRSVIFIVFIRRMTIYACAWEDNESYGSYKLRGTVLVEAMREGFLLRNFLWQGKYMNGHCFGVFNVYCKCV